MYDIIFKLPENLNEEVVKMENKTISFIANQLQFLIFEKNEFINLKNFATPKELKTELFLLLALSQYKDITFKEKKQQFVPVIDYIIKTSIKVIFLLFLYFFLFLFYIFIFIFYFYILFLFIFYFITILFLFLFLYFIFIYCLYFTFISYFYLSFNCQVGKQIFSKHIGNFGNL